MQAEELRKRELMGGKPFRYWRNVYNRLNNLVYSIDSVRDKAVAMKQSEIVREADEDISALLDALVVLDFEILNHFGIRMIEKKSEGIS